MIDTLIEARTRMFRKYSTCTGDTLRSTEYERSTGRLLPVLAAPAAGTSGTDL